MRNVEMFRGLLVASWISTSAVFLLNWIPALYLSESGDPSDSSWGNSFLNGKVPMPMDLHAAPPPPAFRPLLVSLWAARESLSVEIPRNVSAVRPDAPRAPPATCLI